ncbi:MAG TPA: Hpt domain-containing protein [Chloroflexota bacterium]|jgi:two-component system sensor histidine kinase/response regulator
MSEEAVDVSSLLALRQLQRPDRPDAVARIISRFLEESDERLVALGDAAQHDDAPGLERAAHALKGIAGTVGANEILHLAMRLEQIGREGHTAGATGLVSDLQVAFARARPIFDRLRGAA